MNTDLIIRIFIMKNVYLIAGVAFQIEYKSKNTELLLKDYLCNIEPLHVVNLPSEEEIEFECKMAKIDDYNKLENVAILRKISTILLKEHSTVLLHSSAVSYNGKAYLFTAPSGTGKSTHVNNLKTVLGSKLEYINDDKPFVKIEDGSVTVYGSPWCGKHNLGSNVNRQLNSIIFLTRANENYVKLIDGNEALKPLLRQCFMLDNKDDLTTLLALISKLVNSVSFYILGCTKELDSAFVTIKEIFKGDINEN